MGYLKLPKEQWFILTVRTGCLILVKEIKFPTTEDRLNEGIIVCRGKYINMFNDSENDNDAEIAFDLQFYSINKK